MEGAAQIPAGGLAGCKGQDPEQRSSHLGVIRPCSVFSGAPGGRGLTQRPRSSLFPEVSQDPSTPKRERAVKN